MLRISILLLTILTLLLSFIPRRAEAGGAIIAVQSISARPYDEAFNGFKAVLGTDVISRRIILSDLPRGRNAAESIYAASPDLVLAIGMDALAEVKNLKNIPIVCVMVLDPDAFSEQKQITGVSMVIEPEKQLAILLEALPRIRTIGLLSDPEQTGEMAGKIRAAAENSGISLLAGEVYRAKNVPLSMMEMEGKIDAFWMLPDLTVVTPDNVEFMVLFAMESKIPILTFSEKYVEEGALLSISVDLFDMGRQAGEMARKLLTGADVKSIPPENARKAVLSINMRIAGKLGITFSEKILKSALIIK